MPPAADQHRGKSRSIFARAGLLLCGGGLVVILLIAALVLLIVTIGVTTAHYYNAPLGLTAALVSCLGLAGMFWLVLVRPNARAQKRLKDSGPAQPAWVPLLKDNWVAVAAVAALAGAVIGPRRLVRVGVRGFSLWMSLQKLMNPGTDIGRPPR